MRKEKKQTAVKSKKHTQHSLISPNRSQKTPFFGRMMRLKSLIHMFTLFMPQYDVFLCAQKYGGQKERQEL